MPNIFKPLDDAIAEIQRGLAQTDREVTELVNSAAVRPGVAFAALQDDVQTRLWDMQREMGRLLGAVETLKIRQAAPGFGLPEIPRLSGPGFPTKTRWGTHD